MADEAFALSPISARAAQPSEEDYDAISQAFMETSRGRWFLGEYAKRNRNADTSMVLEAVARLEENLAAQRQPEPAPDNGLKEALAAIRSAVDAARVAALDGLALEERLGPVRKGSRIIREIAWRWREIGADGRICDLIDSQINAIEGACGEIASINPLVAFDVIERQLAELGGSEAASAAPQAAAEDSPSAAAPPAPSDEMLAALVEPLQTAASAAAPADDSEATVRASSVLAEQAIATAEAADVMTETVDATAETADLTPGTVDAMVESADPTLETTDAMAETADLAAEIADAMAETADAADEPVGLTAEAADAQDDAILDMIALEMAADDPPDYDEVADIESAEITVAELAQDEPVSVAPEPEPESEPEPMAAAVEPPAVEASLQPALHAAEEPSLGASLISRGILNRPQAAGADPLAPIRRMSQAEKIAFFS